MIFYCIERPPRELDPISEIPLGVSPRALSRASGFCIGARKHRGEALSSISSPHQNSRRSCFARALSRLLFCVTFLRKLRLALVSRLGSSESWLRKPFFEAHRKIARELLMRHLIFDLGLTFHVHRCSLPRAKKKFLARKLLSRCKGNVQETRLREVRCDTMGDDGA